MRNGDVGATEVAREAEHGPGAIPTTGLREQCEAKADLGGSASWDASLGSTYAHIVKAIGGAEIERRMPRL